MKLSNAGELRPYSEMKDSGVEWLGKVPSHWKVIPNRTLFEEVKERDHPEEPMLSVEAFLKLEFRSLTRLIGSDTGGI